MIYRFTFFFIYSIQTGDSMNLFLVIVVIPMVHSIYAVVFTLVTELCVYCFAFSLQMRHSVREYIIVYDH